MVKASTDPILRALRERGLRYPGAHLKSPWPGHLDLAVKDKTFAYLSLEGEPLGIGCKLPKSSAVALLLPFCQPTPYGLGKSGWVSAKLTDPSQIDVAMLEAWIDESYRAQAPKKLVKELDSTNPFATVPPSQRQGLGEGQPGPASKKTTKKVAKKTTKKVAKKTATKKKAATKR